MDYWMRHNRNCQCGCNFQSFVDLGQMEKKTVNIIGGFLGAGKTTMVNHILSQPLDRKIDVIVKELGVISVDDKLLNGEKDRIHTFTGTSAHTDQQTMLANYIEKLYADSIKKPFDNLLIEASGMESAEQILKIFYLPRVRDHYELGSFITVVNAEFGRPNLEESRVANEQTALADHLVINKSDCVEEEEVEALVKALRVVNPFATILKTSFGQIDAEKLIATDSYQQLKDMEDESYEPARQDTFRSVSVRIKEPLDMAKVNVWIKGLYSQWGSKLLRGKGFFNIAGSDYRFDFQSMRTNFHSKTEDMWEDDDARQSVVVFIGEHLPAREELLTGLRNCIA